MDVNVTPTATTPGVSTSNHGDHYRGHGHSDNHLHWSTYLVGKSGEDTRELIREVVGNTKDVMAAVERNHGVTREEILKAQTAIAMVQKDVEINALRVQSAFTDGHSKTLEYFKAVRSEEFRDQIADLKAQINKLTPTP